MNSNIEKVILEFPKQIKYGFSQKFISPFNQKFDNILVCGMGGSALAAEFLKELYPIRIHRNYDLPEGIINKKTLIICISYSGNTEETLSAYDAAKNRNLPKIAISSSGLLKIKALKDNVPFIEIQTKKIEPRMSIIEQISILTNLFRELKIPSFRKFNQKWPKINPHAFKPKGAKIARNIVGKVPLIYVSSNNRAIGRCWKALFNENAKIPAFWNVFPEINHNELMQGQGISWKHQFHIINVLDEEDHPLIQRRMKISAEIFQKKGFGIETIKMKGVSPFKKMLDSITLGNWITLYLAKELNIDPLDPDVREEFKMLIKNY